VPGRQIKLQPESVMADLFLGLTVAGLYTLVGMGLTIVFM
jgi:branched-subunit amino acid ABC-type transport system permease component